MPSNRFNPRARTGRDLLDSWQKALGYSFNPRARTGRDQIAVINRYLSDVSIHAPARGATKSTQGLISSF